MTWGEGSRVPKDSRHQAGRSAHKHTNTCDLEKHKHASTKTHSQTQKNNTNANEIDIVLLFVRSIEYIVKQVYTYAV